MKLLFPIVNKKIFSLMKTLDSLHHIDQILIKRGLII